MADLTNKAPSSRGSDTTSGRKVTKSLGSFSASIVKGSLALVASLLMQNEGPMFPGLQWPEKCKAEGTKSSVAPLKASM